MQFKCERLDRLDIDLASLYVQQQCRVFVGDKREDEPGFLAAKDGTLIMLELVG